MEVHKNDRLVEQNLRSSFDNYQKNGTIHCAANFSFFLSLYLEEAQGDNITKPKQDVID